MGSKYRITRKEQSALPAFEVNDYPSGFTVLDKKVVDINNK
jgi:hypothetical protein